MREEEYRFTRMNQEMQRLIDRAQELVDVTADKLDDQIKGARISLIEGLEKARGQYGGLEDKFRDRAQLADEYVQEKPYHVVGGAFIAGLFMGWLMTKD